MKKIFSLLLSCIFVLSANSVYARPKIGLVLSGGGARGGAHLGVLQVLEELHIPIDYVVGTSMGAIIGGLYASGYKTTEIEQALKDTQWNDVFKDSYDRGDYSFRRKLEDFDFLINTGSGFSDRGEIKLPTGIIQGQKLTLALRSLTNRSEHIKNFDAFPIPFRAVATDIVTGEPVIIGKGSLAMAMRASMSVPTLISPVEYDGKLLVDGGVSNNLPIDVARSLGADILIVVDISTPLNKRDDLNSVVAITDQLTSILTRRNTEEQLKTLQAHDILITPKLAEVKTADFNKVIEATKQGYLEADQYRERLAKFSIDQKTYVIYAKERTEVSNTLPTIAFIDIDNKSSVADALIASRLSIKPNESLDLMKLEEDIKKIYGLDIFQSVTYQFAEKNGETGITITAIPKSWGPNYLKLGLTLEDNFSGDANYNLGLSYKRTAINALNGGIETKIIIGEEPKISVEWYQPLDIRSRYFIAPSVQYEVRNIPLFIDNNEIASYRIKERSIDLEFGRDLGSWGELRFGIVRGRGHINLLVGDPNLPDLEYDKGNWFARFTYDKLNSVNFPREGEYFRVEWTEGLKLLGSDENFDQLSARGLFAQSWQKNTVIGSLEMDTTIDSNAPIQQRFTLGGFQNLSGYQRDALSGQHRLLATARFFRQINDIQLLPAYVGFSLEYGQVAEEPEDFLLGEGIFAGSVFLGVDTFFGPFYLGYGRAEGGEDAFYLYLGRLF